MKSCVGLALILLLAIFYYSSFWVGYGMGDDEFYASMVSELIHGTYQTYPLSPEYGNFPVFQFRPVLLLLTALSTLLAGFNDIGFTLPIFFSHLASIIIIYLLGRRLFNETAGILAALFLVIFPLRLVFATTVANDIMLSALLAAVALLVIRQVTGNCRDQFLCCEGAGVLLGLSQAVKSNALCMGVLAVVYILLASKSRQSAWRSITALFAGWGSIIILIIAGFHAAGAGWSDFFTAEIKYNLWVTPLTRFQDVAALRDHLLFYPRLMFNVMSISPTDFEPYGYFYWLVAAALAYAMLTRKRNFIVVGCWALALFLFMELMPLRLSPYQPIHRLERTLDIVTIPALLLCGGFLSELWRKNRLTRGVVLTAVALLAGNSLATSIPYAAFRKDAMQDIRDLSAFLYQRSVETVYADGELFWGLSFYMPEKNKRRITWENLENFRRAAGNIAWGDLKKNSLVVLGGSRRPDMYFDLLSRFQPPVIPKSWALLKEFSRAPKPWRKKPLRVYLIT